VPALKKFLDRGGLVQGVIAPVAWGHGFQRQIGAACAAMTAVLISAPGKKIPRAEHSMVPASGVGRDSASPPPCAAPACCAPCIPLLRLA